jgi:hypothetical protein
VSWGRGSWFLPKADGLVPSSCPQAEWSPLPHPASCPRGLGVNGHSEGGDTGPWGRAELAGFLNLFNRFTNCGSRQSRQEGQPGDPSLVLGSVTLSVSQWATPTPKHRSSTPLACRPGAPGGAEWSDSPTASPWRVPQVPLLCPGAMSTCRGGSCVCGQGQVVTVERGLGTKKRPRHMEPLLETAQIFTGGSSRPLSVHRPRLAPWPLMGPLSCWPRTRGTEPQTPGHHMVSVSEATREERTATERARTPAAGIT